MLRKGLSVCDIRVKNNLYVYMYYDKDLRKGNVCNMTMS